MSGEWNQETFWNLSKAGILLQVNPNEFEIFFSNRPNLYLNEYNINFKENLSLSELVYLFKIQFEWIRHQSEMKFWFARIRASTLTSI